MKNPLTIAALLTLAAVLAMGADNAARWSDARPADAARQSVGCWC
jgi:hypothetical protein